MTPDALPAFETGPEHVDLDITEETVSKTGGAGAGGTDSETIVSRLLKFGTYSQRILRFTQYGRHTIWKRDWKSFSLVPAMHLMRLMAR